jgi:hypothetical protein
VSKNGIQLRWPTQTNVLNLIFKSVRAFLYIWIVNFYILSTCKFYGYFYQFVISSFSGC